jgi:hypothetical protein
MKTVSMNMHSKLQGISSSNTKGGKWTENLKKGMMIVKQMLFMPNFISLVFNASGV